MEQIRDQFQEAEKILQEFNANDNNFLKIEKAGRLLVESALVGGNILSCGNGGSMCDAMHFAEELTGRFRENRKPIGAIAIADASHLSCVANDYGYEHVFSRYIEGVAKKEDVLLAISTSGNSTNVVNAIHSAKKIGMKVIGLTGKDGGQIAQLCDVEIRAPQSNYADRAQEIHIKIIHALIHFVENNI